MKSLSGLKTKLIWSHNSSRQRNSGNQRSKVCFVRMGFRHVPNMLLPPCQQLGMSATLPQHQIPLSWLGERCIHTCQDYWSPLKPPASLSLDSLYPWHVKRCQLLRGSSHWGWELWTIRVWSCEGHHASTAYFTGKWCSIQATRKGLQPLITHLLLCCKITRSTIHGQNSQNKCARWIDALDGCLCVDIDNI